MAEHVKVVRISWKDGEVPEEDTNTIIMGRLNQLMAALVEAGVQSPAIFAHRIDADNKEDPLR